MHVVDLEAELNETARYLALSIHLGRRMNRQVVLVGIGTPDFRCDSYGPLLADALRVDPDVAVPVYGGSESPVDNLTFAQRMAEIEAKHGDCHAIVFDATQGPLYEYGRVRFYPHDEAVTFSYGENMTTRIIKSAVICTCWPVDADVNVVTESQMRFTVERSHRMVKQAITLSDSRDLASLSISQIDGELWRLARERLAGQSRVADRT